MQTAAQLGSFHSFQESPNQMLAEFYRRDPGGNINSIFAQLLEDAPDVKQADARVSLAEAYLKQAELNLSYCDIVAEIDGVVTRRNVNPGDRVLAGQQLMALRSLTDIWVDANFKETQLAKLAIGQPVDLEVDRELCQGRTAPAGTDRFDQLQPRDQSAVHWSVGHSLCVRV
jgi:membrane fusion protein, multidrug efflux system